MKEDIIKFTEENWKRHMSVSQSFLLTARNGLKCAEGHTQKFPDGCQWICVGVFAYPFSDYVTNCWKIEGFSSSEEFKQELERIYGSHLDAVFIHQFVKSW